MAKKPSLRGTSYRGACRTASWALLLPVALGILAGPLAASLVRELDFTTLNQRTTTLFHGRCIARREVPDGRPIGYTEYTFEVIEAVKGCRGADGKALATLVLRHAGTRTGYLRPDGLEAAPLRLGVPEYEAGEEVVLFLTRESKLGLCSPVGFSQGKFTVSRKGTRPLVRNATCNRGLFEGPEIRNLSRDEARTLRSAGEGIELRTFLDACRKVQGE